MFKSQISYRIGMVATSLVLSVICYENARDILSPMPTDADTISYAMVSGLFALLAAIAAIIGKEKSCE